LWNVGIWKLRYYKKYIWKHQHQILWYMVSFVEPLTYFVRHHSDSPYK
jgi:hypothetical protein